MASDAVEVEVTETDGAAMTLRQAVLVYSAGGQQSAFATVHDIGSDGHGAAVLLPGKPMTGLAVARLARRLSKRERGGFVPPNLLYRDGEAIAWWVPPARRMVWFRTKEFGDKERSAVVPHPSLVFAAGPGRQWWVWAVEGSQRPSADTKLSRAPYFNVWENGEICVGNVDIPNRTDAERIEAWNDAFFCSYFTHVNGQARLVNYAGGAYRFWSDMLDGRFDAFPEKVLMPMNATLSEALRDL